MQRNLQIETNEFVQNDNLALMALFAIAIIAAQIVSNPTLKFV